MTGLGVRRVMQTSNFNCLTVSAVARIEAAVHRWCTSVQEQRDRGPDAEKEWYQVHYHKFARGCLVKHITGDTMFADFREETFNIVETHHARFPRTLTQRILDQIKDGKENLDIINWAYAAGEDIDKVVAILEDIPINECRFPENDLTSNA
jgi:hypothetical protein